MSHGRLTRAVINRLRRSVVRNFCRRPFALENSVPVVSFTFDDIPRSAYGQGGTILARHGLRGTYYISLGLLNGETDLGPQFTVEDLEQLAGDGHELGCHTFDHLDTVNNSTAQLEASVRRNRECLQGILPEVKLSTFAYPFGRVTLGAKRVLSRQFSCCRGIDPRINVGVIDLNLLAGQPLYSRTVGLERIRQIIHKNASVKGWLVFYTHDVCRDPSPFGCTPEYFGAVVDAAIESGATIKPVAEALVQLSPKASSFQTCPVDA